MTKKTKTKKTKLPKLQLCPCEPGYVHSNCPFSYANGWHSQREAILLQTDPKVLKNFKPTEKMLKTVDRDYLMNDNVEILGPADYA